MHAPSDTATHAEPGREADRELDRAARPRLGEIMLADGSVTERDLHAALARQRDEGGDLGEHLVVDGAASRLEVYRALAEQWGLPLRNLLEDPPDAAVATSVRHREALHLGWLACEERAGRLVVATTRRPDASLREEIAVRFGPLEVDLVATTRWDLFRAVERLHGPAIRRQAGSVPAETSGPSAPAGPSATPVAPGHAHGTALLGLGTACAVLVLLVLGPRRGAELALLVSCVVVLTWVAARLVAAFRTPRRPSGPTFDRLHASDDRALPVYTVLMPAVPATPERGDGGAVGVDHDDLVASVEALTALDYPATRLDLVVLLHERDDAAAEHLRRSRPAANVRIVVVPDSAARSLNQACNYGLAFARGRFVVRYDLGDRPDRDQLRRAVAAFDDASATTRTTGSAPPLACVQASVRPRPGPGVAALLTAAWSPARGLARADHAPIDLVARTSHHVDTDVLRAVGAWHPALAAEATDLGLRIARHGARTGSLDSATDAEPAPDLRTWRHRRADELAALGRTALSALPATPSHRGTALLLRAALPLAAGAAWPLLAVLTLALAAAGALGAIGLGWVLWAGTAALALSLVGSAAAAARCAISQDESTGIAAALVDPLGLAVHVVASGVAGVRILRRAVRG